ncbi:MAG: YggS family pyridoxal phosphate-dependent enzyme [Bacteroidia bacterium]|nr:YggS family pyridoxal phosphate-dependent enzyme [Bacteroidia bacterium]
MAVAIHLAEVRTRIRQAAIHAGRDPESVRLVAVSKTKPVDMIREALEAGQTDFGENRVQEMQAKYPELPEVRWHLIGTLQTNKVKYIAPYVHLIHSVDSTRLLAEIDRQAGKVGRTLDCLLQLHISDEATKSGMDETEAAQIVEQIDLYPHIRIRGLMGMAALTDDRALIRQQFRSLRIASGVLSAVSHPRVEMQELSMGMSGDFDIAIEEGATLVRIGSAVFGGR